MVKLIAACLMIFCLMGIAGESKSVSSANEIAGKWSSVRYKNDQEAILALLSNKNFKYYPGNVKGFEYTFSKDNAFTEVKTFANGLKETTQGNYKVEKGTLHLITIIDRKNNTSTAVKHKVELSGGYLIMHRKYKENGSVRDFVTTFQPENVELGSAYNLTLYVKPTHVLGEDLKVTVALKNISNRAISYDSIRAQHGSNFELLGPGNKPVVATWWPCSWETNQRSLEPGKSVKIVDNYELADSNFLIKEVGPYTVRFQGTLHIFNKVPTVESNTVHFQMNDGKLRNVDRLAQQLVGKIPNGFRLGKSGHRPTHRKPKGWSSSPCDMIYFGKLTPPKFIAYLWQTDQKLEPENVENGEVSSIYLGEGDYGHLYFSFDKRTEEAWPTAVEDLKKLLIRKRSDESRTK